MKTSTRISMAAIVVWTAFIMVSANADLFSRHVDHDNMIELVIVGAVVCILLKFILGAFVDKKSNSKPE
jgi:hypothetical protein